MSALGLRLDALPTAGLIVAAALAAARVAWNLTHSQDLFLDSWVLVHVLRVLGGESDQLPRAALTLQYPIAYLPLYPVAKVVGAFTTVKLVYPVLASMAAVPAYLIVRKGPAPIAGVLAMLFLPDLVVKTLTGTPQGIALPLFLLALHFALRGRRKSFLLAAVAVLFTHHLTGLVTLVLYFTLWLLPRSREHRFIRSEWPYVLFFAAWPLYWAWTFSRTGQSYMAPALLTLVVFGGVPLAGVLYLAAPRIRRAVERVGRHVAALPASAVLVAASVAGVLGWSFTGLVLDSPGLSTDAIANRTVVSMYMALLVIGGAAALARRSLGLTLFMVALLALGSTVLAVGCQHVFDGLRVVDYALLGGLAALYAPGLKARWSGTPVLLSTAAIVLVAGGLRLEPGYDRLFAHSESEREAARWIEANTSQRASFATDIKMSLLILGEGDRNATFEGTWWLFDGSPIASYMSVLNSGIRFRDRPISYVLLSDYMLDRGADVTWFSPTLAPDPTLLDRLDRLGDRIYDEGGVTIWEMSAAVTQAGLRDSERIDLKQDLLARLYGGVAMGPCR